MKSIALFILASLPLMSFGEDLRENEAVVRINEIKCGIFTHLDVSPRRLPTHDEIALGIGPKGSPATLASPRHDSGQYYSADHLRLNMPSKELCREMMSTLRPYLENACRTPILATVEMNQAGQAVRLRDIEQIQGDCL